jgi:hypothetical protein
MITRQLYVLLLWMIGLELSILQSRSSERNCLHPNIADNALGFFALQDLAEHLPRVQDRITCMSA